MCGGFLVIVNKVNGNNLYTNKKLDFLSFFYQKNTKFYHFKGVYVSNQQENIILISFIKNDRHEHKKETKKANKENIFGVCKWGG